MLTTHLSTDSSNRRFVERCGRQFVDKTLLLSTIVGLLLTFLFSQLYTQVQNIQNDSPLLEKFKQILPTGTSISDLQYAGYTFNEVNDNAIEVRGPDGFYKIIEFVDNDTTLKKFKNLYPNAVINDIDTNQMNNKAIMRNFTRIGTMPIGYDAVPILITDLNKDGLFEFVGFYKDKNRNIRYNSIYEQQRKSGRTFKLKMIWPHFYSSNVGLGIPVLTGDVNNNGLPELMFTRTYLGRGIFLDIYESQASPLFWEQLPTNLIAQYDMGWSGAIHPPRLVDLDKDGKKEFLYNGGYNIGFTTISVAEFDTNINNFVHVWSSKRE